MTTQRPRRQRKGDRLISPGASKDEIMVDHAVASFDRVATEMERKWGADRLPELVPAELAMKYGGAIAFLNEAINNTDAAAAAAAAQNCIKGLHAMDAAATAAGHQPPQAICHYDLDGFAFRIIADAATSTVFDDDIPAYTLREVANALQAYLGKVPVQEIRDVFPNAEVTRISPKLPPVDYANGGDPIPF